MKQRPIGPLVDALTANGSAVAYVESKGCLPLSITASEAGFKGGHIQLAASVSSQYVSSILLCAPYASEDVVLELTGDVVISQPYIDLTIAMMATFGIEVERVVVNGKPSNTYRIPRGTYTNPATYNIESDASSATYPLALAAISGTTCTIHNIGSSSLQGDARFAKDVLEPMGCTVVQTATETTVTGPPVGQLRALGYIDMEPMTDAFLTAAAIAAVARLPALPGRAVAGQPKNSTRIGGIANQRVKECNRIDAMRTQLHKFGVLTHELDDGIEVLGIAPSELKSGASVHCFDDHRVAMAFSVLAAVPGGPGAIIEEKRCVEKTWPSWWDDLERKVGISLAGVELPDVPVASSSKPAIHRHSTDSSIFVLGMRGAGKTHIGKVGGAALGWPILDADAMFKDVTGVTAKVFVEEHGWPKFRVVETSILKDIIATKSKGCIVSLGGGVIETPENRDLLRAYANGGGPIVHIIRDIDEILAYLNSEPTRPSLGEDLRTIYNRRLPWFHELSNFEFTNILSSIPKPLPNGLPEGWFGPPPVSATKGAEDEVARFFKFMTGVNTNHLRLSNDVPTHALTLDLSSFTAPSPALKAFDEVIAGADALEVRVDLLSLDGKSVTKPGIPASSFIAVELAALRQRSTLPIIFSLRTVSQGGMFPDEAVDAAFELLELGIKAGCEYIHVQSTWDTSRIEDLVAKRQNSKIIASHHDLSGKLDWSSPATQDLYELLARFGDVVKIVSRATSVVENLDMMRFREKVAGGKPLISFNVGPEGQLSRILSPVLGPVTHRLLPTPSLPGAITFAQVQTALHLLGSTPKKQFYLFGTPIQHSKSPLLHNTAFGLLGLPHEYGLLESGTITNELKAAIRAPNFGGASVTIPHKLEIMPLLDEISVQATIIGAVNTIVPIERDGVVRLRGDNTDYLGLRQLILKNLSSDNEIDDKSTSLVLGAGGTCRAAVYALHSTGFKTSELPSPHLLSLHFSPGLLIPPAPSSSLPL